MSTCDSVNVFPKEVCCMQLIVFVKFNKQEYSAALVALSRLFDGLFLVVFLVIPLVVLFRYILIIVVARV